MENKRTGFLITARLKSTRLPRKLLLDIDGKTMVERVIDRAKKVKGIQDVVLCTSLSPQDRPLADIALRNQIFYFLGSEEDVLQRLLDAAHFFAFDYIINITGENPLFSIEYAYAMVDILHKDQHDFVYIEGLPIGCAVYGLKTKALEVVCKVKKEVDTEIWGLLINQPDIFDIHRIIADQKDSIGDIRITSDYQEDYELICTLFNHLSEYDVPPYSAMINHIRKHPEVLKINEMHRQMALDPELADRINRFYRENKNEVLRIKADVFNGQV